MISPQYIKLRYLIVGLFLLTSCSLATKQDIADLRKDVREVRAEIQSEARKQESLVQRQTALVVAVKDKVSAKSGLAGMIVRGSPWSWFGLEFLPVGGFAFFASLRLNRIYIFRRTPMTDDEYESLTIASWVLNKFLGRRTIEQPQPDPDPPDDKPPLRVVR